MPISFNRMHECQDKRVKMRFDDGIEVIAQLVGASQDMDGSLHLVYDNVEWVNDTQALARMVGKALYAPGESLVSIDEVASTAA
jgi:small nuclear ribonucleoprotein (snRNP)-like protein